MVRSFCVSSIITSTSWGAAGAAVAGAVIVGVLLPAAAPGIPVMASALAALPLLVARRG